MLRLGIVGTNWITKRFVDAAHESGLFELRAVYSRKLEKAQAFAKDYPSVQDFKTDLEQFMASPSFEVVYIASPNSLHFSQAKAAIKAGKHVIVEKPICLNPGQMQELRELLAEHQGQFLFEAARHTHEPNYLAVKEAVAKLPVVQGATLTYMKYSSRYDAYLAGENPNIFSPKFAGGALQDLGVYMVHCAVGWFGKPLNAQYFPTKLANGIDAKGIAILTYQDFTVTLNVGKTANSYLPGEIYGLKETIWMDNAADLKQVELRTPTATRTLSQTPAENELLAEAVAFGKVLTNPDLPENKAQAQAWLEQTVTVNEVMYQLRQSSNLYFEDEN
ncbi:Gfo/Idh/MocA family protein [Ligilactobacillus agilis]|jgi:predicted dehydrogenase|uniref:Gfo/Idh/MocA family protein n=1 Tax=Ligilactobacillus agilis TaxID=1601 RepID=UPI0022DFE5C6|nr:Gfo/Idh/MocA family oxidoreductase [Ligilactobacillus agilis]